MRILCTGAEGFVGKHLVKELRDHGHRVIGTDIGDADLAKPGYASEVVRAYAPHYVVHLAARYGRILCRDQPHRAVSDNAAATTEIAAACAADRIPVLYTSTSEVYGDHGIDLVSEDSELRMPTTIYGLSKRWGEEALRLYMPPGQLCIVRPNMLYGPNQHAGYGQCALATFIQQALNNEPMTVHRDASRSWLFIADAVRAVRLLVEGRHSGVFNLGNDRERMPMENLAELVRKATNSRSEIRVVDAPPIQIRHKNYDCTRLAMRLAWGPEVKLHEGIARTVPAEAWIRPEPVRRAA